MSDETNAESRSGKDDPWGGAQYWTENRSKYTYEQLAPYAGQTVAWLPDGSGVAEVAPDVETLYQRFEARGEDCSMHVFESFPPLPWDGEI